MASIDGDVYRALRNRYEAICEKHEQAAAASRAERLEIRASRNAVDQGSLREGERSGPALD